MIKGFVFVFFVAVYTWAAATNKSVWRHKNAGTWRLHANNNNSKKKNSNNKFVLKIQKKWTTYTSATVATFSASIVLWKSVTMFYTNETQIHKKPNMIKTKPSD